MNTKFFGGRKGGSLGVRSCKGHRGGLHNWLLINLSQEGCCCCREEQGWVGCRIMPRVVVLLLLLLQCCVTVFSLHPGGGRQGSVCKARGERRERRERKKGKEKESMCVCDVDGRERGEEGGPGTERGGSSAAFTTCHNSKRKSSPLLFSSLFPPTRVVCVVLHVCTAEREGEKTAAVTVL